ncbi:MAG: hypothetical protein GXY44_01330 [Phycisphaerales bacterium]|nr:hypothetical protein [Phycisphaerales bacterium]
MTGLRQYQRTSPNRPLAGHRSADGRGRRNLFRLLGWNVVMIIGIAGCTIQIPSADSLFSVGTPFVLSGTTTLSGGCLVWIGDNGITYYLYQDAKMENELFDRVVTPGVTSRLKLVTRTDLTAACHNGPFVEVLDVLEIVE